MLLLGASAAWAKTTAANAGFAVPPAPAYTAALYGVAPTTDWLSVGGDSQEQHYSALSGINTGNVGELQQAWMTHLDGSGAATKYKAEQTGLEYAGVLYMVTGNNDVFALDATNGNHLWTYLSNMQQNMTGICCGWDARGLAMGDNKIFLNQLDGFVVALDQQTGAPLWKTPNARWQDGTSMTAAPLYYQPASGPPLVIVGQTGAEYGVRASITAFNANTGQRIWRFYTVPEPGEIGGATWPADSEWQNGGGSTWNTPSVDPNTGMIYFTTGNAGPWSGRGPGDNLFTSSMVALDAASGTYQWHFQMVHHDLWDYDCPSPTLVFDTSMGAGVAEACKTGWLYEMGRFGGQPYIQGNIVEKAVPQAAENNTWPTQPYPQGDAAVPQCTNPQDFPTVAPDGKPYNFGCIFNAISSDHYSTFAPTASGGENWEPMSFLPVGPGWLYTCEHVAQAAEEMIPAAQHAVYVGGKNYTNVHNSGTKAGANSFGYGGTFSGFNAQTNKILWQIKTPVGENCDSGSLATAGNVVFWGHISNPGFLEADNALTGQKLWQSQPTLHGVDAPPITYIAGGKQYVVVMAGAATVNPTNTAHGDEVYAYTF